MVLLTYGTPLNDTVDRATRTRYTRVGSEAISSFKERNCSVLRMRCHAVPRLLLVVCFAALRFNEAISV